MTAINDYDRVADLYDTYVPATFDIDFFIDQTKEAAGEVLELISGTGRVSIPLLQAGVKLACVDMSAESNSILKRKLDGLGLRADVRHMDVCQLDLGRRFAMVIIPFHSFAHVISREDQRRALQRIRQHLLPGGAFICTLHNPAARREGIDGRLQLARTYPLPATGGELILWVVESFSDEDPDVVRTRQFYEEYDRQGRLASKRLLELQFRLTARDEFESLAVNAGFRVRSFYGDYSCSPFNPRSPFMIWVLKAE